MPHRVGLTEGAGIEKDGNVTGMVNNKGARKGMQDFLADIDIHQGYLSS